MALQATELTLLLVFSAGLSGLLASLVWRERPKAGAGAIAITIVGDALWGGGQVVVFLGQSLWLTQIGFTITLLGTALIPPAWYVFSLQYTGQADRVSRRLLGLFAIEPVLLVGVCLTNGVHELIWVEPAIAGANFVYSWGIGTVLHFGYSYLLILAGNRLLFEKFLASRNVYRTRTFLFLFIALSMLVTSLASVAGYSPVPHLALTPIYFMGIAVLSLVLVSSNRFIAALPVDRVLAMLRSRSKNLSPAARDRAIEELRSGYLVTDHKNRIVDVNPTAQAIFGREGERFVGRRLETVLPPEVFVRDEPAVLEPGATGEFNGVWVGTPAGERRCFDTTVSPLGTDEDGDLTGRVALVHDVTERERRKQKLEQRTEQLERQNEHLESFAGIVSHDLRNPLNVADGHLALVEAEADTVAESIEEAQDALERMETIIDDVLTLARLGQTVGETEPVELGETARAAWETVDTSAATLECPLELTVDGNEQRLRQLFENLYRNSIEHGRADVRVRVGALDGRDGFFVADDGPGIPADRREAVFDEGHSTAENGTGFGLAIVQTIVEAHGWDVSVTESAEGGARFEVTGLARPTEQPITPGQ